MALQLAALHQLGDRGLNGEIALDLEQRIAPVSAIAVTALLVGVAGAAGWLPARRAARTPPTLALKGE